MSARMLILFSHVQLFATLWTIVHHGPLSVGLSRQEYQSGLPWSPPEKLLNTGIEPMSRTSSPKSCKYFHKYFNSWRSDEGNFSLYILLFIFTSFSPLQQCCASFCVVWNHNHKSYFSNLMTISNYICLNSNLKRK